PVLGPAGQLHPWRNRVQPGGQAASRSRQRAEPRLDRQRHGELPLRGQYDSVTVDADVRPLVYTLVKVEPVQRDDASTVGSAPAVAADFHFSMVTWSFLLSTYVPSTMVVIVSWIAFWVDAGAAASRVTLGVACLLMLVAQVGHNRIASPHDTQLQPGDVWFFVSAVAVFCSLLEFVLAHGAYRDQARAQGVGAVVAASAVAEPRYRVYRKPPTMNTLTIVCDAASQTERSYRAYRPNELDVLARGSQRVFSLLTHRRRLVQPTLDIGSIHGIAPRATTSGLIVLPGTLGQ
ncbi:hypothetical protein MTO96_043938, partial [Rhipicephalus appendiculatus]